MDKNETERVHTIVHETIELTDELVNMGHSPQFALELANGALTNYRLEIVALQIDQISDRLNAMMAIHAIEKIRAIRVSDGDAESLHDLFEKMKQQKEPTQ